VSAPFLEPATLERVRAIGPAELVVGIPSYDNAATIAHVVRAVAAGLARHFPTRRAVLVNSDGGSRDATREIVATTDVGSHAAILVSHPVEPLHRIVTPYQGVPGKGSALRTIFAIAARLQAQACAVVDSDLRSITPEWVELLLAPVVSQGFDYVAPLYLRHKFDGTITNSIVYPLTRALYGREVRQPIGGEFGFSGRLAAHYLSQPVWDTDVARFGIDIWMTTTALAEGFRVCQSFLGAKIHDPKDPGADLTSMLVQVVSSVFDLMERYHAHWSPVMDAAQVPLFGFPHGVGLDPVNVNLARMLGVFRQGVRDLGEIWALVLEPGRQAQLAALAAAADARFRLPDALWVGVVYDFALAWHRHALPRDQLLRSLVPLYLGRTASFVLEHTTSGADEVESAIRTLADEFVRQKPWLRARWL
jgi:glucosylglycerate synthase